MHELAGLIREFPFGSFIIILSILWACERTVSAIVNRNKPVCDCECCHADSSDDDEEGDEEEE
jgi:hypothetical protein